MMRRTPALVALTLLVVLTSGSVAAAERRPGGAAFLRSLLVPGWGQYGLGGKNSALAFVTTEFVLIGGMLTLNAYGESTRDDYRSLAAAYAGVTGDHAHDFYVDVGNWMTVDQYNERRLQERDFDALYTSPEDRWAWDSDTHRAAMEQLRIKSDRAFNSILYLVGGLVLNHVSAAIHAGRLAVRQSEPRADAADSRWALDVRPVNRLSGLRVKFTYSF